MSEYTDKIDNMNWSFSRRDAWDTCKFSWHLTYIQKIKGEDNGWGDAGTLAHEILEQYGRKELRLSELAAEWIRRYDDEVTHEFMPSVFPVSKEAKLWIPLYNPDYIDSYMGLHENYKWKVFKFFTQFQGFSSKTTDIELKFEYKLPDGSNFLGFIDRVSEGIIVTDYKISNIKKFKPKIESKKRQILLYAPAIKDKYGKLPKSGYFYFIQTGEHIKVEINQKEVDEALKWMTDGIAEMREATEFPPILEGMDEKQIKDQATFCKSICSHRDKCKLKTDIYG